MKPRDIPRDVWDKAAEAAWRGLASRHPGDIEVVARAMLAGREQPAALIRDLSDALDDMTKHYVEVRNDLFGMEAAEEIEVIASRKLIEQARGLLKEPAP